MTKLLDEETLNKISGGAGIPDDTIKNMLGYDWTELSTVLGPFIAAAKTAGYTNEANTINGILTNKTINFLMINSYKTAITKLYPFAVNNNYTEVANVLTKIAGLLGMSL